MLSATSAPWFRLLRLALAVPAVAYRPPPTAAEPSAGAARALEASPPPAAQPPAGATETLEVLPAAHVRQASRRPPSGRGGALAGRDAVPGPAPAALGGGPPGPGRSPGSAAQLPIAAHDNGVIRSRDIIHSSGLIHSSDSARSNGVVHSSAIAHSDDMPSELELRPTAAAMLEAALRHAEVYNDTSWRGCVLRWHKDKPQDAEHMPDCIKMCLEVESVYGYRAPSLCLDEFMPRAFANSSGAIQGPSATSLGAALSSVMAAVAGRGTEDARGLLVEKILPAAYEAGSGDSASRMAALLANDTKTLVRAKVAEIAVPAAYEAGSDEAASRMAALLANDTDTGVRAKVAEIAVPAAYEAGSGEAASRMAARLANDTDSYVRQSIAEGALPAAYKAGSGEAATRMAALLTNDTNFFVRQKLAGHTLPAAYAAGSGEAASRMAALLTNDTREEVREAVADNVVPAAYKAGSGEAATRMAALLTNDTHEDVRAKVAEHSLPAAYGAGSGKAATRMASLLANDTVPEVRRKVVEHTLLAAYGAGSGEAATSMAAFLANDADWDIRMYVAKHVVPAAYEAGSGEGASRIATLLANDTKTSVRKKIARHAIVPAYKAGFASIGWQILMSSLKDSKTSGAAGKSMANLTAELQRSGAEGLQVLAAAHDSTSPRAKATARALLQELLVNLSAQAGSPVERNESMLCASAGSMLLIGSESPFGIQAHHCPNAQACVGTRCLPMEHPDRPTAPAMCHEIFNRVTDGCSQCERGLGRSLRDPFHCEPCGHNRWRQAISHVAPQAIVYAMALRSSNSDKTTPSSVMKIIVAFGTTASATLQSLLRSEDVKQGVSQMITDMIHPAIFSFEVASGGGGSSSIDCLLSQGGDATDLTSMRAVMLAVPLALLALTAAALLVYGAWLRFAAGRGSEEEAMPQPLWIMTTLFIKAFVVWTTVFLPTMLIAALLSCPCVRTQATPFPKQSLAWDMDAMCDGRSQYLSALFVFGVVAAGPLNWLVLIAMAHVFPPKMLSFLVGGYKDSSKYWEVAVLSRRAIDIMIIVMMPLSYAAFPQTLAKACLMATALALHTYAWPYEDGTPNLLEFLNLFSNTIAVILTAYVAGNSWSQTSGFRVAAFLAAVALLVLTGAALLLSYLVAMLRQKDCQEKKDADAALISAEAKVHGLREQLAEAERAAHEAAEHASDSWQRPTSEHGCS